MLADILIPITGTAADAAALDVAAALAGAGPARLTALRIVELPYAASGEWSLGPDPRLLEMYDELRRTGREDVAQLRDRLQAVAAPHEVRLVEARGMSSEDVVASEGIGADLVVVAGGETAGRDGRGFAVAALLRCGRPLLVVPPGGGELPPGRVTIAWKRTPEAARAVHDAMPWLASATQVDVVTVDLEAEDERGGSMAAVEHLRRHGVQAAAVDLRSDGRSVAGRLQDHAVSSGAQLLVAGGYGHSRLREWVLGGVTRELLQDPALPVLLSH